MAALSINASHRKHFKAGCWTKRGVNRVPSYRYGLTRSARRLLRQAEFEDDQTAAAEARRVERQKLAELRESRRQERNSPVPRPGFLKRAISFLKGLAS